MGPLNVKCQLIWAGHGHLSAMGTNYRKSKGQTAQFLAYTTFLMIAEASIKTEIKVVILSQKLFSSVKYNALLVQFFILSRTKFIDVTYWHDGTSWRLMFISITIIDDDFDVVVMWILILSFLVMWRLSIELKHAIIPYNTILPLVIIIKNVGTQSSEATLD